ncbi:MAG TPA: tripartite tricarboxylate transporter substrate-binding protein [Burkholderiales bacterium]|nr:tripartite tricarboxylate transporter substrate-binding protein [Burkholderiales bacterium]
MRSLLCALLFACAQFAAAQGYPAKPLRLIVGYSAGGGADALARLVAGKMSEALGQQVLVENRPGAGATIAAAAVASAAPDGYTLFFADTALLIAPGIYQKLSFDPVKSFAPVSGACTTPLVVVVNSDVKAQSIAELIALAKASPDRLSYGSPGIGTVHHLAMETFKRQAKVAIVHVPYKGASAIIPDVISGQIQVGIISAPPALAQSKAGRLRPLALTSPVKVAGADWPALADTLPGFDASPRLFVLAPAGTPEDVIARLNSTIKTGLEAKDLVDSFTKQGAFADWSTPQALGARMAAETLRWAQIAKDAGIKAE